MTFQWTSIITNKKIFSQSISCDFEIVNMGSLSLENLQLCWLQMQHSPSAKSIIRKTATLIWSHSDRNQTSHVIEKKKTINLLFSLQCEHSSSNNFSLHIFIFVYHLYFRNKFFQNYNLAHSIGTYNNYLWHQLQHIISCIWIPTAISSTYRSFIFRYQSQITSLNEWSHKQHD